MHFYLLSVNDRYVIVAGEMRLEARSGVVPFMHRSRLATRTALGPGRRRNVRIAQTLALNSTLAHLHFGMRKAQRAIKAVLAKVHLVASWTDLHATMCTLLAIDMRLRLLARLACTLMCTFLATDVSIRLLARIIEDIFHFARLALIFGWA
jgi:hypothetical protein